jgi:hypothetical protein
MDDETVSEHVRRDVEAMCAHFPIYKDLRA